MTDIPGELDKIVQTIDRLKTAIGEDTGRIGTIRAEAINLALACELGDAEAVKRRGSLRREMAATEIRVEDRRSALEQAQQISAGLWAAELATAATAQRALLPPILEQRLAAAVRVDAAIAELLESMGEVERLGAEAKQVAGPGDDIRADRIWQFALGNLCLHPLIRGDAPAYLVLPEVYFGGLVRVLPVSEIVRSWSPDLSPAPAALGSDPVQFVVAEIDPNFDQHGAEAFFLERAGQWFALNGWTHDRGSALRWGSAKDAAVGLADLRKEHPGALRGDVEISAHGWNPAASLPTEATGGVPMFPMGARL